MSFRASLFARRLVITLATIVALVAIAAGAVYTWPLDDDELTPASQRFTFAAATARIAAQARAEEADLGIRAECRSRALLHPEVTAKAVLMLHGYLGCPAQFAELAMRYHEHSYNVYMPLLPRHGTVDPDGHTALTAQELTAFAGSAMDVTASLGSEAGVAGSSAGALLATWLTTTRPEQVHRLLAVAPFYRPSSEQAPSVFVKPMAVLYGFRILPDRRHPVGFSYAVLAQFMRLSLLLDINPTLPALRDVAVVTSPRDRFIDLKRATSVPAAIAEANGICLRSYEIPPEANVGHEAIDLASLGPAKDALYLRYIDLYEAAVR
ncbi:alpha/beta hydrolase [Micromonospora sp. NBC_00858]|uniref:alpha/beta hydrolase n=1 Tax=Micromonospora sp. NBC_00858 TaxID=2975979 RepID=UPI00386CEFC9|nr:hypothetical protein OG990_04445 [Micromonospora sp. NBC_00858]